MVVSINQSIPLILEWCLKLHILMQWGILVYLLYKHPNTPGYFLLQIVAIAEESGGSIGHAHMGFSRGTNSLFFHSTSHQYLFSLKGLALLEFKVIFLMKGPMVVAPSMECWLYL